MDEERQTSCETPKNPQEMFESAFERNDTKTARELLEQYGERIDVDVVRDANGFTLLMHACLKNWSEMVYVLGEKADWTDRGDHTFTALHMACFNGNLELVQFALERNADINALDDQNCSSLWYSVMSENADLVSYLLKHDDMDISFVNLPERSRYQTCLYLAARNKSTEIVLDLIEHGATVNQQTATGSTPIWIASQFGRLSNVQLLLKRGADPKMPDEIGKTPLHMASMDGDKMTIDALVAEGCDPLRETTDNNHWNALHFAASNGHKHVLKHFVEVLNIDLTGLCGDATPLHRACLFGHEDCVRYLVKHGMTHTSVNEIGPLKIAETPLQIADSQGHSLIVDFLRSIQDGTVSVADLDSDGFLPVSEEKKSRMHQYVLRENPDLKPIRDVLAHVEKDFHEECAKQFLEDDWRMPDDETVELCVAPFRDQLNMLLNELVDSFEKIVDKCTRDNEASRLLEEFENSSPEFAKFRSSKAIYREAGRNAREQHNTMKWDAHVDHLNLRQTRRPLNDENQTEIVQPHRDDMATLIAWCVWTQQELNRWICETCKQGTTTSHAGKVKSLSRVAEKMGMYVGERDRMDPSNVLDYVRGMKSFASLELLVGFLNQITCRQTHPEIYVFKIKNRFYKDIYSVVNPWQDVMVHFVFTDVPREHRVICELQLTLDNILFTRKSMGGHGAYALFRNAIELREAVNSRRSSA